MRTIHRIRIPEGCRCISLVGGGGKTTLMLALAKQLVEDGKRVIVTTTTHMLRPGTEEAASVYPEEMRWNLSENAEWLASAVEAGVPVLVGRPDPDSELKMIGVSESFFHRCRLVADVVLVEADGSRRRPVKVPGTKEPVIPEGCDLTIAVLGLSALNGVLSEVAFRPEETAEFLGKSTEDRISERDLIRLAASDAALKKSVTGAYRVLLNQADNRELYSAGERILSELEKQGICGQVVSRRECAAVILLAAGNSRRFRGNKLLADDGAGGTVIRRAMECLERSGGGCRVKRILVSQYDEILRAADRSFGWNCVKNDRPDLGIAESIKRGILAAGACDSYVFCVGDQPFLRPETIDGILREWQLGPYGIVTACSGTVQGNPKLFSACYREELLSMTGDRGGNQVAKRHRDDVTRFETFSIEELQDMDTREDWQDFLKKSEKNC